VKRVNILALGLAFTFGLTACSDSTGLDDSGFDPSWISASWTGGAKGAPNDRTDREPTEFQGRLCPTSSISLDNREIDGPGSPFDLILRNQCTLPVFTFTCVTAGIPLPFNSLLESCATDPLNTPKWPLGTLTIESGNIIGYSSSQTFAVNIFFCSDETILAYDPIRCI